MLCSVFVKIHSSGIQYSGGLRRVHLGQTLPYMDSSSFASTLFFGGEVRLLTYIRSLASRLWARDLDGLTAHPLPIAYSCISHTEVFGFCRCRSDLFASATDATLICFRAARAVTH